MLDKTFTPPVEKKKVAFQLNSDVLEELELYVQCGQESYKWLTTDAVLEQFVTDALKKDRGFRSWLKQQKKAQRGQITTPPTTEQTPVYTQA